MEAVTDLKSIEHLSQWLEYVRDNPTSTEVALDNAIAIYKACANEIDRHKELQGQCKLLISEIFAEIGHTRAITQSGMAQVTSASVQVRYDTKCLDALCEVDEGLHKMLAPHRIVTERPGTLTIR